MDESLFMMKPYSPHTGQPLPGNHLIHVGMLAMYPTEDPARPHASLFSTWDDLVEFEKPDDECEHEEKIFRLVPKVEGPESVA